MGWSRQRRVIVLRRRLKDAVGLRLQDDGGQPQLAFLEIGEATDTTNTQFWSLRSMKMWKRSVSSIATGATERTFSTR